MIHGVSSDLASFKSLDLRPGLNVVLADKSSTRLIRPDAWAAPILSHGLLYVRGKARRLTMDLFFDTYEVDEDVRVHTGPLVALLDKNPATKAPPVLLFSMGQFNFQCVLVDASQRFTMFRRDGSPVRSVVSAQFQEFVRVEIEVTQGLFIGPPTLHTAIRNETASAIAGRALGDPARWREVAEANGIDDPLNIPTGATLKIPQRGA